jgi:hypothetical protein
MIPGIGGIDTGGGGLQYSGGTQASEAGGDQYGGGGHIFNFGPPPQTGLSGINVNQIALYGVAALVLWVALKR